MNDSQMDRLLTALEKIQDEIHEIATQMEDMRTAVDNLCGAAEHVTGNIGPNGCLKVKVLP
jgi:uncharacterized protein YukE